MLLGQRIKSLRKSHGLTQEALGKKINVTKVSISCYENETRTPSLETLLELCKIFNVDPNSLFGADHFVAKEEDFGYGVYMSNEEVEFLVEIRKNNSLHRKIVDDPKRMTELISKKVNY
jgi:transcriptional regulator with XRE-family HTH domain